MDRIIGIRDKDGDLKAEQMARIIDTYGSLDGEILYKDLVKEGCCLCFVYANQDAKMMRTSTIKKIDKRDNNWVVTTRNSIYVFEINN